jgi:hypothetical protein
MRAKLREDSLERSESPAGGPPEGGINRRARHGKSVAPPDIIPPDHAITRAPPFRPGPVPPEPSSFQLFSISAFQHFSFSAFQLFSFSAFQLFSFSAFQLLPHNIRRVRSPENRCPGPAGYTHAVGKQP